MTSSSSEEKLCYEIRSRTRGRGPATDTQVTQGRVGQVVAAFEAGMVLHAGGKGSGATVQMGHGARENSESPPQSEKGDDLEAE
ncbi:unnamed protein product [Linum trigynum]|uniref:Uncharacterized protein n=1 Tax=Linum trigynum TaxID=586398 RepID=A0AAV2GHX9_9ROSI